ncbi:diguanylate cyclase [Billgrantia gudaonensis]|nr:diguanylate cyclase [Halomonas gudaonensis]
MAMLALFIAIPAAAEPHPLPDGSAVLSLDAATRFYRGSRESTLADVMARPEAFSATAQRGDLHFGYTRQPIWLRTEVVNESDEPKRWFVQFEYPFLERITLHIVTAQRHETLVGGSTLPRHERPLPYRLPAFPLSLAPGEVVTLFAQVESAGSMMLSWNLMTPEAFTDHDTRSGFWLATYFGMLLALGLYNLLLFSGLRERVFLHYALFVFSFTLAILSFNGLGPLMFWGHLGELGTRLVPLGFTLASAMATRFAQSFLQTATHQPRWHRLLGAFRLWCWLAVFGVLIISTRWAMHLMDVTGFTAALLLLLCALHASLSRVPGARLFVLAWSIFLVGAGVFALRNQGILPSNFLTLHGIQIGSALEMLLLSFALAARFNKLKRLREKAQVRMLNTLKRQESLLEQKVAERTAELETLANHDMLTGLLNRNGLAKQARDAFSRSRRNGRPLALLMLDLDDFKPINDRYGHDVGDRVLQQVARRIAQQARDTDHCARYGGDEFIVLAETVDSSQGLREIEARLADTIRQPIQLENGHRVCIGVSIGSCLSRPGDRQLGDLLRHADQAMYARKAAKSEKPTKP